MMRNGRQMFQHKTNLYIVAIMKDNCGRGWGYKGVGRARQRLPYIDGKLYFATMHSVVTAIAPAVHV